MFNVRFNPMQMMNAIAKSTNPTQTFMKMSGQYPELAQAAQVLNGKTPEQVYAFAKEQAKLKGFDLDVFMREMGFKMPE